MAEAEFILPRLCFFPLAQHARFCSAFSAPFICTKLNLYIWKLAQRQEKDIAMTTIDALYWKPTEDGWHAEMHDTKTFNFFVEQTEDDHWAFRYHGPDGLTPPFTDFDNYTFEEADDAKDAALKHFAWLGGDDPNQFDDWYEEYRQNQED
jgi:hypothetical protein